MKISVDHTTVYRYEDAVFLDPHTLRFRPRTDTTQRLLNFQLQITPLPAGATECLDQDGNLSLHAWFQAPTRELKLLSRFTVQLLRTNPFDFILGNEFTRLPLWYSEPLCVALAPYRNDQAVGPAVKQFAHSIAAEAHFQSLPFLSALNQHLFQSTTQLTRPEGPPWTSDQTLSLHQGSCRDLAVLFCDVCRVMGFAARFVSGYECAATGREDSYMHAWAEVYLPGAGWRGYDPSRGLAVANSHVAVAAGFDYDLASPVSGLYRGGCASHMEATLHMTIDPLASTL